MKRAHAFYRLHFLNLPYAAWLKFTGKAVYVYHYAGSCARFLRTETFPSLPDFRSVDEWRTQKALAFRAVRARSWEKERASARVRVKGREVDLGTIYLQNIFREEEQRWFFRFLAHEAGARPHALSSPMFEKWRSALAAARVLRPLLGRGRRGAFAQTFRILSAGISPAEYPTKDDDLSFAWLVENDVVKGEEILYLLHAEPSPASRDYLRGRGVRYATFSSLYGSLGPATKLRLALSVLAALAGHFFRWGEAAEFRFRAFVEARAWMELFPRLSPRFFLTSFSAGWPEQPEVALARALGIRTIDWFYGTSEFGYATALPSFRDENLRFSLRAAHEHWIWNPLLKELIEERSFLPSENEIVVAGPILNGHWRRLTAQPKPGKFRLAVFDISPMRARVRLQHGEGPFVSTAMQEALYAAMLRLLARFPDLEVVVKTKRNHNPEIFEPVPSLDALRKFDATRVTFPGSHSDPYAAIAEADLVISPPYTSPPILALELGRKGIFYDPTRTAMHTYREAFRGITLYSEEELVRFVEECRAGKAAFRYDASHFPAYTPEEMRARLRARLAPENFREPRA